MGAEEGAARPHSFVGQASAWVFPASWGQRGTPRDGPGMRTISPEPLRHPRPRSRPSRPVHRPRGLGAQGHPPFLPARQPLSPNPRRSGPPGGLPGGHLQGRPWNPNPLQQSGWAIPAGASSARSFVSHPASGSVQTRLPIAVYAAASNLPWTPLEPASVSGGVPCDALAPGQGAAPPRPVAQPPWCLPAGRGPGSQTSRGGPGRWGCVSLGFRGCPGGGVSVQTWAGRQGALPGAN